MTTTWFRGRIGHIGGAMAYVAIAGYCSAWLWVNPGQRGLGDGQDQALYEWMLAHAARSVTHLENPLLTSRLNVPQGGNIIANASVLGLGLPMTPFTIFFGPAFAFALLYVVSLAGTATGWYFVLGRHLVSSRAAAWTGGACLAFAPGMISESIGHLHLMAQFLIPWIADTIIQIFKSDRCRRNGIILGVLVAYQALISEEILLFAALTGAVFLAFYALTRPGIPWRSVLSGLAVATGIGAVLLAFPLWVQFMGPQHVRGLGYDPGGYKADLAAFTATASETLGGDGARAALLAQNPSEQTSFLGWPILILAAVAAIWLYRHRLAIALMGTAVVFAALSLGPSIMVNGTDTGIPGPYKLLRHLPILEMALPTRFALITTACIGILLTIALDRAIVLFQGIGQLPRRLAYLGVACILLTAAPTPLSATAVPQVPAFFADGLWRQHLPAGRTLIPVPLPAYDALDGMRWSTATRLGFPMARGYLVIPDDATGRPDWSSTPRPTSSLLANIAEAGTLPPLTDADRENAAEDLHYWNAGLVVLGPREHQEILAAAITSLLGTQSTAVGGILMWEVPRKVLELA